MNSPGAVIFSKFFIFLFVLIPTQTLHAASSHLKIVEELVAYGQREFGTTADREAAQYIRNQFQSLGISRVVIQPFKSDAKQGYNVVAVVPGRDESHQIILGAHHDSAPGAPGAYDDAAGVSVLLNVAAHFTTMRPPYTLVFCSFDGEEAGLLGSIHFTRRMSDEQRRRTLFMLCMEMMGWEKGYPNLQTIKYEVRKRRGEVLPVLSKGVMSPYSLTSLILSSAEKARVDLSIGDPFLSVLYQPVIRVVKVRFYGDDISFLLSGIPAVMFTDSSFSAFYPDYHQPGDVLKNLSEDRLVQMNRLITTVIHRAKSKHVQHQLTSRQEQEYWILGPIHLNFYSLLALFLISQSLLLWHSLMKGPNRFRFALFVVSETVLSSLLFSLFPTFIFFLLAISAFVYLIFEALHIRHRARLVLIYLPHLLVAIFVATAAYQRYLYGTYLSYPELVLLLTVIVLSYLRIAGGSKPA